ncbi:hypothetical protein, partial [Bradyrhizobium sp.]|uniref:hypothetical protein n=1 Tax=Bradyrhizobium sp. TaxID=376 RepID=UPI003C5074DF
IFVIAMLLNDICHSIDSPNMGTILENIKFPKYPGAQRLQFPFVRKGIEPQRGNHEPPYRILPGRTSGFGRNRAGAAA